MHANSSILPFHYITYRAAEVTAIKFHRHYPTPVESYHYRNRATCHYFTSGNAAPRKDESRGTTAS